MVIIQAGFLWVEEDVVILKGVEPAEVAGVVVVAHCRMLHLMLWGMSAEASLPTSRLREVPCVGLSLSKFRISFL